VKNGLETVRSAGFGVAETASPGLAFNNNGLPGIRRARCIQLLPRIGRDPFVLLAKRAARVMGVISQFRVGGYRWCPETPSVAVRGKRLRFANRPGAFQR
jgi:hypothetical protein